VNRYPLDQNVNFLGQTPLHLAVARPQYVQTLLEARHDLNAQDKHGITPLMYAAAQNQTDVVISLINAGADIGRRDTLRKRSFLDYALARGHWDLVIRSLQHIGNIYGTEGIDTAVQYVLIRLLKSMTLEAEERRNYFSRLLEMCENVNFIFGDSHLGVTENNMLHYIQGREDGNALVKAGFTGFNQKNSRGQLALMSQLTMHRLKAVKFCIENGTQVKHQDNNGHTVLFPALHNFCSSDKDRKSDDVEAVILLLHSEADTLATDKCKCPCSPQGCFPAALLSSKIGTLFGGDVVWTLEWLTLLEEHRSTKEAKTNLLSILQRYIFDELEMMHVCCHKGSSSLSEFQNDLSQTEEDIREVQEEEEELIAVLNNDMADLALESYESLKKLWMQKIKGMYDASATKRKEKEQKITDRPRVNNYSLHFWELALT